MNEQPWPRDWLSAALNVSVMRVLLDRPSYGYAITQRLAAAGLGEVKGGTLYPLLGRLEEAGHVDVEWRPGEGGPGRKYFSLTTQGEAHARSLADSWAAFTTITRALTDGASTTNHEGN